MSDIFLSYKKEEKAIARIYAGALEMKGFSVWWDPDIDHGAIFDEVIQEQLDAAKCVIVLWSSKSVKSKWVRAEATSGEERLVPVLIEEVKIPVPFNLIQTASLIGWRGDQTDPEFLRLMESVSRKLGRSPHVERKDKVVLGKPKISSDRNEIEKIPDKYTNSIGMKFTHIQEGEFMMGSEESDFEKPIHEVTIASPFYLGIYQVTQKEWKAVMGNNPSSFKGENLPVETVSWNDVQEFIKKLNEKENVNKYRLPSEAEWEYAARAGASTRYSFGDDESKLGDYAWYADNSGSRSPKKGDYFGFDKKDWLNNKWNGETHPVGEKKPNHWGIYDMHGNVWEWVQDRWHGSYDGAPDDGSSWESGEDSDRVIRGGSWSGSAGYCRSACRNNVGAGNRFSGLGFRLLRLL